MVYVKTETEWKTKTNATVFKILDMNIRIIRQIKSRRMRWAGHVARMGEGRNVYRVLVEKSEGNRPLGRPRHRWEGGIKLDLEEIGWGCVDWIHLA
jgi:hypothetical protein